MIETLEKYLTVNLFDMLLEAISYSKVNEMSLKDAFFDLIREHLDKTLEIEDLKVSKESETILNMFISNSDMRSYDFFLRLDKKSEQKIIKYIDVKLKAYRKKH